MPKMKTRKSAAKRYSLTGTGKVKYKKKGTPSHPDQKRTKTEEKSPTHRDPQRF
jgi:large subunit ribosomal protein L35